MVLSLLALLVPKYKYCAACVPIQIMRRFEIVMLNVRFLVYSHTLCNLLPTAQRIFRIKGRSIRCVKKIKIAMIYSLSFPQGSIKLSREKKKLVVAILYCPSTQV